MSVGKTESGKKTKRKRKRMSIDGYPVGLMSELEKFTFRFRRNGMKNRSGYTHHSLKIWREWPTG